jgi:HK97 gp10 family phage protein
MGIFSAGKSVNEVRQSLGGNSSESVVIAADLVDFLADLENAAGKEAEGLAQDVVEAMTLNVAYLAEKYAPTKTGELAQSIRSETGSLEGRVWSDAPHAFFVEFGTWSYNELAPQSGTYEIKPINAKALRFDVGGQTVFAKSVQHPGIKAQPFMRPALQDTIEEFAEGMADVGVMLLMGKT